MEIQSQSCAARTSSDPWNTQADPWAESFAVQKATPNNVGASPLGAGNAWQGYRQGPSDGGQGNALSECGCDSNHNTLNSKDDKNSRNDNCNYDHNHTNNNQDLHLNRNHTVSSNCGSAHNHNGYHYNNHHNRHSSNNGNHSSINNGYKRREGTRKIKFGSRGERLEVIDWQGVEIVPVQKDFSFEHPAVAARSEEECEQIRTKNSIHVLKNFTDDPLPKPVARFEEAPFPDWAAAGLRQNGFEKPTPIQVQAWPVVLKGYDFVGIAETGSGKTIAYLLPMLVHLMAQPELRPGEGPIGLVLVPTRDLCLQVAEQVQTFTSCTGIVCRALYGGEDINLQTRALSQRMDIAIATPGRLIALLNYQATNLRRATFIVLDEADELLGKGFGDQVRLILGQVRPDRQVLLFSATWPSAVESLALEVCHQRPIHINVGSVKLSACKSIKQWLHRMGPKESKPDVLCQALSLIKGQLAHESLRALVFCNYRNTVEPLVEELRGKGYPCEGFHGEQTQTHRDEVLRRFAAPDSGLWLLVCTQILGRGHDFRNVRFVINYDMPQKIVEYIHRIGRTGRVGQEGYSLTFITDNDLCYARDLAMVLRESHQEVPDWLSTAAWQHRWRFHQGRGSSRAGIGVGGQSAWEQADGTEGWSGRGRGRRGDFLAECQRRGVGRQSSSS